MNELAHLNEYERAMICMIYGGAYVVVFTQYSSFTEVMDALRDNLGKAGSHFSLNSLSRVDQEIVDYMKENSGSKYMIDLGEE